ncbi:MAG: alpha/beta hydrolase-fold protein [Pseudomonadota bacterium]
MPTPPARLIARLASLLAVLAVPAMANMPPAPLPHVAAGHIVRLQETSRFVPPHTVDVWLPPGYPAQAPYAVLYMFDGQMLFDATQTWNHQSWRAADTAAALIRDGHTRPFIIVGIWNDGERRESEYYPQKAWRSLTDAQRRRARAMELKLPVEPYSDDTLRFLVDELKPRIERRFRVATDAADTAVMGSSMGGLMAMYAISEYPQVFGGAGCLSTHWPGTALQPHADNPSPDAFVAYLHAHAPAPDGHRVYFDHGTATLDAMYAPTQQRVDRLFRARGYTQANFRSGVFPSAAHTEDAWAARLARPMQFLLPPRSP